MQSPVVQSAVPVAVAKCGNVKKRKKVFTVLLAAVFVLMGGSILTLIALMAGIRWISFVWNFIPFGCFAVAAVSMPVVMFQKNKYANLAALAERIESKDATVIASLSPVQTLPGADPPRVRRDESHGAGDNCGRSPSRSRDSGGGGGRKTLGGRDGG